ncbi:cytochrome-c peroxidase [Niastella koreensis]|uniref:Cytochrome-c peroxidase n=2 Tax=Niastella koreensis TaxID=354356 RepID=G8TI16_NIAKG|nr:cytochrome c peroxidase [Niastella koreensis]AEV99619.1 Cytochrome-c peroxidase [Niastella koreensis GR20-10]OQP50207.1 cytochrome-c peroxidase [Niastella koreensis]
MKRTLLGFFAIVLIFSCKQNSRDQKPALTKQSEDSLIQLAQKTFKILPVTAESKTNPLTPEKIKLGKILFFDVRLSKSGNNSCNSCHNLETYGVDNEATSVGDAGKHGGRNSPTVYNAALQNMQFWDGRAVDVEEQAGMPILNPVEMAIPHKGFLINRLSAIKLYQDLFKDAFPGEKKPITYENLQKAIGAFERTLLTPSRFDKYMAGDTNAITMEEKSGLRVFVQSGCTGCHNGVGVGGGTLQKFGLVTDYRTLTNSQMSDEGKKQVTHKEQDKDVFKVPELRNVEGTHPYFHDGSIARLDTAVKIMGKAQLNKDLSATEIKQVVAFLNALSGQINPAYKTFPEELNRH